MVYSKFKTLCAAFALILVNTISVSALRDVPNSHWAKEAVDELYDYGFMKGDPNGSFRGTQALSRYEFAKTVSRMVEFYNEEIDSDRKDIENLVSIMESFQQEIKSAETKLGELNMQVEEQNAVIGELNELVVMLGEEVGASMPADGMGEQMAQSEAEKIALLNAAQSMEARLIQVEEKVGKLQNKGLIVDTLIKGTFNDIKKIGGATGRAVKSIGKSRKADAEDELASTAAATESMVVEEVQAKVEMAEDEVEESQDMYEQMQEDMHDDLNSMEEMH